MKKVLVLVLVLGMVSLASAGLQISVNGDPNPVDSQIVLKPSDTLTLDVWTDAPITPGVGEGYTMLVTDEMFGEIIGGRSALLNEPGNAIFEDARGSGWATGSQNGVWFGIALSSLPSIATGTVVFDQIQFHCNAIGDATILLVDVFSGQILDSLIIHQIPEPITMTLLGLGGLFLRRRK